VTWTYLCRVCTCVSCASSRSGFPVQLTIVSLTVSGTIVARKVSRQCYVVTKLCCSACPVQLTVVSLTVSATIVARKVSRQCYIITKLCCSACSVQLTVVSVTVSGAMSCIS